MNRHTKLKKITLIAFLCFFIISVIGVKSKAIGRLLLAVNNSEYYYFGDLYELSKLKDFKDKLLVVHKDTSASDLEEADIITMGDSFFETNFDTPTVSYELEKLSGKKVFHVKREDFENCYDNPLAYLDKAGYVKGQKKYLVLETVERYALDHSISYQTSTFAANSQISMEKTSKIKNFLPAANLQYFFYNNWLIAPVNYAAKNFRFKVLDEPDKRTPVYSENPKMLFYYEDVNFNSIKIPDENIDMMANNVKFLQSTLKDKYNIELIYCIMPTKYTIYGKYTSGYVPYNNFIPRTYNGLIKKGIKTFDMYSVYIGQDNIDTDLLYYKGDSHFTAKGKSLLVNELLKFIPRQ